MANNFNLNINETKLFEKLHGTKVCFHPLRHPILSLYQRGIQSLAKHLRCSVLREYLTAFILFVHYFWKTGYRRCLTAFRISLGM